MVPGPSTAQDAEQAARWWEPQRGYVTAVPPAWPDEYAKPPVLLAANARQVQRSRHRYPLATDAAHPARPEPATLATGWQLSPAARSEAAQADPHVATRLYGQLCHCGLTADFPQR